jgi:hypothetical protein
MKKGEGGVGLRREDGGRKKEYEKRKRTRGMVLKEEER